MKDEGAQGEVNEDQKHWDFKIVNKQGDFGGGPSARISKTRGSTRQVFRSQGNLRRDSAEILIKNNSDNDLK